MSREKPKFLPLDISPSTLADRQQHLLANLDTSDAKKGTPSIAPSAIPNLAAIQRGMFSEFALNDEFDKELSELKSPIMLPPIQTPTSGKLPSINTYKKPPPLRPIKGTYITTHPPTFDDSSLDLFASKNESDKDGVKSVLDKAKSNKKAHLDYRKALEPNVLLPYVSRYVFLSYRMNRY